MVPCPSCGEPNAERARFCSACGTALAGTTGAPRSETRRTVTVLFADVAGSTGLGERLDAESLRRVMARYFAEVRRVIERHEGTVEKFIGDAVMAVFGIPDLHEDDALRAVRAGVEMRQALAGLNAELERDWGARLRVRTGINTGEVVAGGGAGETLVTGDAVNVAARLQQGAEPDEILIGEATHRLVRDAVDAEPVEERRVRGRQDPVRAFRLLAVMAGAEGHARRLDSPLVGRDRELQALDHALERAVRYRSCQLFTLLGPAGVGKSRLVHEFLHPRRGEATVLRGRCLPYGEGITYWPVAEAVRDAAGIADADSAEEARAKLGALTAGVPQGELVASRVSAAIGLMEATATAEEMFWAVRRLLETLARTRPVIVAFDDIQWAAPAFFDLVEHIADWTRDAPILVLCIARPELLDVRPGWGGGKLNATAILLEPLGAPDVDRLLDNLVGEARLPDSVRSRIAAAAEGNPLFVEELLAMLIDDGLLQRQNGAWSATADLAQIRVPPTIASLLAARLDRLGPPERGVIERASVIGKVFSRSGVAELSPADARPEVPTHLMTLVRKELIRPDSADLPDDEAFRFRHILVRDAAYETLTKGERATLHERAAEWVLAMAGDRLGEYEEIVGYHLEQAYRYRTELAPGDAHAAELAERAAGHLGTAARRRFAQGDVAASVNLSERAIGLLPLDSRQRLELEVEMTYPLISVGRIPDATDAANRVRAQAEALGDERLRALGDIEAVWIELIWSPSGISEEEAFGRIRDGLAVLERTGTDRDLARALERLAQACYFATGGLLEARTLLERARGHARRAGDERAEITIVEMLLMALFWSPIPLDEVEHETESILAWSRERGHRLLESIAAGSLGRATALRGHHDEGRRLVTAARAMAGELGFRVHHAARSMWVADIEMQAGDFAAAESVLRDGYEALDAMGERGWLAGCASLLADVYYELGRFEESDRFARITEERAIATDITAQVGWRAVRAKLLAREGRHDEAERVAREAHAMITATDYVLQRAHVLLVLAEVLSRAEKSAEARDALVEARTLYERKGVPITEEMERRARTILG